MGVAHLSGCPRNPEGVTYSDMDTTTAPTIVEVDARGRVSLGKLGLKPGLFIASTDVDGAVLLEPAAVTSALEARLHANPELHQQLRAVAADLSVAEPAVRRRPSTT